MKDQVLRAKAYFNFTPTNSTSHFVKDLKLRIKDVERAISQFSRDSRISRSTLQKMKALESTLLKASRIYPDCAAMVKKLRAMTSNAEEQVHSQRSQEIFLKGLGARTIPKGLHCFSMRSTAEYFALEVKERELPNKHKLRYPDHYHFAIFSDNILACSVVVNSTISTASGYKKPLWKAGSLPIGWITFYTHTIALDKAWHVLGLGYDSALRQENIDHAAVLHFDGILKPWLDIGIEKYMHFWRKPVKYEHPYLQ